MDVLSMFRLAFWDEVEDVYEVDMSCLKPYAVKCLIDRVNVQQVEPQNIMAHAAEICHLDLHKVHKEDLEKVKVKYDFVLIITNSLGGAQQS